MAAKTNLHVLIMGGGLGGLCLAQGLHQAGISIAVYERDRTPTDREQGYRIHLDPQGIQALQACLPPHLFELFLETSGDAGEGFIFLDHQLQELLLMGGGNSHAPEDPLASHKSVSRITLRQILLAGLNDVVHFGKTFTHYATDDAGRVTAFFEDGTSATGDLLVAADGGNSRVRKQLLPHAQRIETGVVGIMGKIQATECTRALLPPGRFDIAGLVLGPKGRNLFIALHEFNQNPRQNMHGISENGPPADGLLFDDTKDYIMWGLLDHRERFAWPGDPVAMTGEALQALVHTSLAGWHPQLQRLICESDPSTVIYTSIRTSTPVEPWPTCSITLVGDAIHSMTPIRGMGGNTALRDARLLCTNLVAAQLDDLPLLEAVRHYESEMVKYGFAAVRQSQQTLDMLASANPLSRTLLKSTLRGINGILNLKERWVAK